MRGDFHKLVNATLCMLLIDACSGTLGGNPEKMKTQPGGSHPGQNQPPEPGSAPALTLSLTDAPVEDARNVYVSIKDVQIAQTEGEWITIPLKLTDEVDLLALQDGKSAVVAAIDSLPAGTYGQTRLILADETPARLIDKDGIEHALKIASGDESGLKIQTAFTKEDGKPLELTIDFDLRKSIKEVSNNGNNASNGNQDNPGKGNKSKYMLKPVLRLADNSKSGGAAGEGQDGSVVCVYAKGASKDNDDACDQAITSVTVKGGQFKLSFLEPGSYDLRVFRNKTLVGDVNDVVVKGDKEADKNLKVKLP